MNVETGLTAHTSHLDSALRYAQWGWSVFPLFEPDEEGHCSCKQPHCRDTGKHPRVRHGVKNATLDERRIRAWWDQWPAANIAIATGLISRLVVVDIDPRHSGNESLRRLERQYRPLPRTLTASTGGGGTHIYLKHPGGNVVVRNVSGLGTFPGLDIKGDGGYVVAPPSLHASGRRYRWQ